MLWIFYAFLRFFNRPRLNGSPEFPPHASVMYSPLFSWILLLEIPFLKKHPPCRETTSQTCACVCNGPAVPVYTHTIKYASTFVPLCLLGLPIVVLPDRFWMCGMKMMGAHCGLSERMHTAWSSKDEGPSCSPPSEMSAFVRSLSRGKSISSDYTSFTLDIWLETSIGQVGERERATEKREEGVTLFNYPVSLHWGGYYKLMTVVKSAAFLLPQRDGDARKGGGQLEPSGLAGTHLHTRAPTHTHTRIQTHTHQ